MRGNWASKLTSLARRFSPGRVEHAKTVIVKAAATEALSLVKREFRASTDPYGEPWKALKRRQGKPLRKTGRLGNSFSFSSGVSSFRIGSAAGYAIFHQRGTRRIPVRSMLPRAIAGSTWEAPIYRVMQGALNRWLRGQ